MSTTGPLDEAIDARIRARELEEFVRRNQLPQIQPPPPDSWEGQKIAADQRKREQRRLEATALEERQRTEREEAEQLRRERWEAEAPARRAAELAALDEEIAELQARRAELEQETEVDPHARQTRPAASAPERRPAI